MNTPAPLSRRHGFHRSARNIAAAAVASAGLMAATPGPANAAPLTCSTGFYAVVGDQFKGGNPGQGQWANIGGPHSELYNAIGYNTQDNYVYGIGGTSKHLLRINSNGAVDDLGAVTGLPTSGTYNRADFDESGHLWTGGSPLYAIDVATMTVTTTLNTSGATIVGNDYGYYNGALIGLGGGRLVRTNLSTGVRTNLAVISGLPSGSFATNALWTTNDGRVFLTNDTLSAAAADKGIWEIVNPYGSAPFAVHRAPGSLVSSGGDAASCYQAAAPWPAFVAMANTDDTQLTDGSAVTFNPLANDTASAGGTFDATSVRLLDGTNPVTSLTNSDGTYDVNTTTGEVTFTPAPGFTGPTTPVTYQVKDSQDRVGTAKITFTLVLDVPVIDPRVAGATGLLVLLITAGYSGYRRSRTLT